MAPKSWASLNAAIVGSASAAPSGRSFIWSALANRHFGRLACFGPNHPRLAVGTSTDPFKDLVGNKLASAVQANPYGRAPERIIQQIKRLMTGRQSDTNAAYMMRLTQRERVLCRAK